jgi:hypothetical protein
MFTDTQDSRLGYYEHFVLCRITRSLFFLHKQYLSYKFFLFPAEVDAIPDFANCTSDNERKSLKAMHALDRKTRADIITMNLALADIFLVNLPKAICKTLNQSG